MVVQRVVAFSFVYRLNFVITPQYRPVVHTTRNNSFRHRSPIEREMKGGIVVEANSVESLRFCLDGFTFRAFICSCIGIRWVLHDYEDKISVWGNQDLMFFACNSQVHEFIGWVHRLDYRLSPLSKV